MEVKVLFKQIVAQHDIWLNRYLNTKSTKYLLRADHRQEADLTIGLFAKVKISLYICTKSVQVTKFLLCLVTIAWRPVCQH